MELNTIADLIQDLIDGFSERPDSFWKLLVRKIQETECSENQLTKAVKEVVSKCGYHQLSISEVMKAISDNPEVLKGDAGYRNFRTVTKPQG